MKLNKFTEDMRIISKLSDNPTETASELKAKFDESGIKIQNFINEMIANLHNAIWPVGSVYISVDDNNPEELFGGTWAQIKDRFILAAGDTYKAGDTGGEESVTLSKEELPSHKHNGVYFSGHELTYGNQLNPGVGSSAAVLVDDGPSFFTGETGENKPHNNMPPYLAVYVWQRIG
jgi:hypothetical protein